MPRIEPLRRSRWDDARLMATRYICDPYEKGSQPVPGYYWLYNLLPSPIMAHIYESLKDKPLCISYIGTHTTLKLMWKKYPNALLFPIPLPDLTRVKQFDHLSDPHVDSEAITHPMKHE